MSDENKTPSPEAAVSKAALLAALAQLSPSEKRALLGVPTEQASNSPKMSPAIDAVPAAERVEVIQACGKVLKAQSDPKEFAIAFNEHIQSRWPELAFAMTSNAAYRRKELQHSLRVVVEALARKDA